MNCLSHAIFQLNQVRVARPALEILLGRENGTAVRLFHLEEALVRYIQNYDLVPGDNWDEISYSWFTSSRAADVRLEALAAIRLISNIQKKL